jgi:hypothetical protein
MKILETLTRFHITPFFLPVAIALHALYFLQTDITWSPYTGLLVLGYCLIALAYFSEHR